MQTRFGHTGAVSPRHPAEGATPERVRIGIYLQPSEFDDAKAAYLADWNNGGSADTFATWVAAAIVRHAARTPLSRSRLARNKQRGEGEPGIARTFAVPAEVITTMRAALSLDRREGHWQSESAWYVDAIAAAVDAARAATGGRLPTPPPRLPNRLRR